MEVTVNQWHQLVVKNNTVTPLFSIYLLPILQLSIMGVQGTLEHIPAVTGQKAGYTQTI